MGKYIPKTASARMLQTQYRKLLNEVKETHEPIVIMSNNTQEAVIIDIETYERLREAARKCELEDTLEAIREYDKAEKEGKLKTLHPGDLLKWMNESDTH